MRNRIVVLAAAGVLLLAAVVTAGVWWWRDTGGTPLERATRLAPAASERFTWTDWSAVRAELGSDVDASSGAGDLRAFLDEAFESDLSSTSALLESAEAMQESYGFSPASLEWELLAQSAQGATVVMRLADDTSFEVLADRLADLGYQRPDSATGVWEGGVDLLPTIGTLTPELQYLALDADQRLVVASDTADYARVAIEAATGEEDGFEGLAAVLDAVGEPVASVVYSGDVVCNALAMGNASDADQAAAEELVAAAGEVDPLTGFAMAEYADGDVRVAMSVADEDRTRVNADTRARLASGPAPGQGGDFSERFRLGRVAAQGEVVTMRLRPTEGSYVLSDLSSGPVLFATC